MYYIVEVSPTFKMLEIDKDENLDVAKNIAYKYSAKTGLRVEVLNETGQTVAKEWVWRE